MNYAARFSLFALTLAACAPTAPRPQDAAPRESSIDDASAANPDAADDVVEDARSDADAATGALTRCPAGGDVCFTLTPAGSGLPARGANATVEQYALRPTANPRGNLLIFLNGSGGSPRGAIASATTNFFTVARDLGLHVLAVSYRSDDAVGLLCATAAMRDECFLPTRTTILTGRYQPGTPMTLSGIAEHEGVYARVLAALVTLHREDPTGGWGAFFDPSMTTSPEQAIRWPLVIASGHSQGGGHAALLGRRHALERVVALASPCDNVAGVPASWQRNDGSFATDPAARFVGIATMGDRICSAFPAVWESLRMAPAARMADAVLCAGFDEHAAPLKCAENAARWRAALAAR